MTEDELKIIKKARANCCNYRVVRRKYDCEISYSIYEIHYDDAGEFSSMTIGPVYPVGESLHGLLENINKFKDALGGPVLDYDKCKEISEKSNCTKIIEDASSSKSTKFPDNLI